MSIWDEKIINIFGVTICGLLIAQQAIENDIKIRIFDNDPQKDGVEYIDGVFCSLPREVSDGLYLITVKNEENQKAIKKQLQDIGIKRILILSSKEQEQMLESADDRLYLEVMYRIKIGKRLNIDSPVTFNEKLQYLKLFDRKEKHTIMVDKYKVKDLIKNLIGEQYVIPSLGVWKAFDEIDFSVLPDQFVLKCNHDSGSVYVCTDKKKINIEELKERFETAMKRNYFYSCREWPYKNIKPCIFAEEYIKCEDEKALPVYKLFCFNGEPKLLQFIQNDKMKDECIDYYDMKWNFLDIRQNFPNSKTRRKPPKSLNEMIRLAKVLSADEKFVRVDFYEVNENPVFSEFTFYSDAGFEKFDPPEWDKKMGEWIVL